jgi:hypothetical protein
MTIRTARISVEAPLELVEKYRDVAEASDLTVSQMIRQHMRSTVRRLHVEGIEDLPPGYLPEEAT